MAVKREEITTEELKELLKQYRITLDCGHKFCLHNLSNTMVITADGETICHE